MRFTIDYSNVLSTYHNEKQLTSQQGADTSKEGQQENDHAPGDDHCTARSVEVGADDGAELVGTVAGGQCPDAQRHAQH